jgi:hypothetical protein
MKSPTCLLDHESLGGMSDAHKVENTRSRGDSAILYVTPCFAVTSFLDLFSSSETSPFAVDTIGSQNKGSG